MASGSGVVVAWNPDTAARNCRGAAKKMRLFDNQNLEALACRRDCGRKPGSPGSNDDRVPFHRKFPLFF